MRENDLLEHVRWPAGRRNPAGVRVGPGDDCAVIEARGPVEFLTVDQVIEGRHFKAGTDLNLIARKAVARSVSDIAAMGGTPVWSLGAGAIPKGMKQEDAATLCDRLHHWAMEWGCPMVGGDIAGTDGPLVISVTMGGVPHPVRGPVLRSGAKAGDSVYITGRLGGSLASGRHLTFEPRVVEGRWLAGMLRGDLHAMMDVSDGVGVDGGRMAAASGVRMVLEAITLPRHEGVLDWRSAAGDGEDYELLFTVAAGSLVPERCPETGTGVTRIGRVVAGSGCIIVDGGKEHDATRMGWEHA